MHPIGDNPNFCFLFFDDFVTIFEVSVSNYEMGR
jgi:hypothetical protein